MTRNFRELALASVALCACGAPDATRLEPLEGEGALAALEQAYTADECKGITQMDASIALAAQERPLNFVPPPNDFRGKMVRSPGSYSNPTCWRGYKVQLSGRPADAQGNPYKVYVNLASLPGRIDTEEECTNTVVHGILYEHSNQDFSFDPPALVATRGVVVRGGSRRGVWEPELDTVPCNFYPIDLGTIPFTPLRSYHVAATAREPNRKTLAVDVVVSTQQVGPPPYPGCTVLAGGAACVRP